MSLSERVVCRSQHARNSYLIAHLPVQLQPYETMFGVPMKLRIANSALPRNLTINMTTQEGLEKVININNECTGDIEDEDTDHEPTLDLELQGNDITNRCQQMPAFTEMVW